MTVVTALRGKIDLASLKVNFDSVEVRELMNEIKISASADLDRHYPKYWSGRVAVRLLGGQSYSEEVIIPKGESGNPMTAERSRGEVFGRRLRRSLGDQKARSVIDEVSSLESRNSLRPHAYWRIETVWYNTMEVIAVLESMVERL